MCCFLTPCIGIYVEGSFKSKKLPMHGDWRDKCPPHGRFGHSCHRGICESFHIRWGALHPRMDLNNIRV